MKRTRPDDPERPTRFYPFFPVTLLLIGMMLVTAGITGALGGRLSRAVLDVIGFPPRTLAASELYRIVTSAFATPGPRVLRGGLLMVGLSVGLAEWTVGSLGALVGFWLIHTVSLVVVYSGGAALHALEPGMGVAAALLIPDVGPSAGYLGCLGLALGVLSRPLSMNGVAGGDPPKWRGTWAPWLVAGVFGWLVLDLAGVVSVGPASATEWAADWAHLVAFSIGIVAGRRVRGRVHRRESSP